VLLKDAITVNDVEIATVLPFSYHVVQKYRSFDCFKELPGKKER